MELQSLRERITHIDREIIEKLAERFSVAKKIGNIKRQSGNPIEDVQREQTLAELHNTLARSLGLNCEFIGELFGRIISESKRIQGRD